MPRALGQQGRLGRAMPAPEMLMGTAKASLQTSQVPATLPPPSLTGLVQKNFPTNSLHEKEKVQALSHGFGEPMKSQSWKVHKEACIGNSVES